MRIRASEYNTEKKCRFIEYHPPFSLQKKTGIAEISGDLSGAERKNIAIRASLF